MKLLRHAGSLAFIFGLFTAVFAGIPWYVMVAENPVVPWWLRIACFCLLGGILVVLGTLSFESVISGAASQDPASPETDHQVLLLNSDNIPGQDIAQVLGLVQGHTVFAVWLGKDLSALARLILGGELIEYTRMMGSARTTAAARMTAMAARMGADAVINVRYTTTSVVGSAAELLVYGTAVKFTRQNAQ